MKSWQRCLLHKKFCIFEKTTCEGGLFLMNFYLAGGMASPPSALVAGTSQRPDLLSASLSVWDFVGENPVQSWLDATGLYR